MKTKTFMMMVALLGASPLIAQDASDTAAPPCPAGTAAACDTKGCETQACGEKSCPVDGCPTAVLTVETLTVAAANGDPIAQYMLAYLTETGVGMPQDSAKAAELYAAAIPNLVQAAEAGDPRACKALARAYAEGRGVTADPAKSEAYMKKAADCKARCCAGEKASSSCCQDKKQHKKHHRAANQGCCVPTAAAQAAESAAITATDAAPESAAESAAETTEDKADGGDAAAVTAEAEVLEMTEESEPAPEPGECSPLLPCPAKEADTHRWVISRPAGREKVILRPAVWTGGLLRARFCLCRSGLFDFPVPHGPARPP